MMHTLRKFAVGNMEDSEELARKLTDHVWCLCTGFRHKGYLYLNDSTSEDAIVEFAIYNESTGEQVESITFGWCKFEKALEYIKKISGGEYDSDGNMSIRNTKTPKIEDSKTHQCNLCK